MAFSNMKIMNFSNHFRVTRGFILTAIILHLIYRATLCVKSTQISQISQEEGERPCPDGFLDQDREPAS